LLRVGVTLGTAFANLAFIVDIAFVALCSIHVTAFTFAGFSMA
jgi:hypothetical protein